MDYKGTEGKELLLYIPEYPIWDREVLDRLWKAPMLITSHGLLSCVSWSSKLLHTFFPSPSSSPSPSAFLAFITFFSMRILKFYIRLISLNTELAIYCFPIFVSLLYIKNCASLGSPFPHVLRKCQVSAPAYRSVVAWECFISNNTSGISSSYNEDVDTNADWNNNKM